MVSYNIVTDECQRVLNLVSEELFALRTDYKYVDDDIKELREYVCGRTERVDQTASQAGLDEALTAFYDEVDPFFESLAGELGQVYLAMQDVLNYFVSGDAEMDHNAGMGHHEFPYELTTTGAGDPPPAYDTRQMWVDNPHAVPLSTTPDNHFSTSLVNHAS